MKIAQLLVATAHAGTLDLDYFENTDVNYKAQFLTPLIISNNLPTRTHYQGEMNELVGYAHLRLQLYFKFFFT